MMTESSKKTGKVVCPHSWENASLLSNWQVHYTTALQVKKWGMCKSCRDRIKANGKSLLNGKTEAPVTFDQHHQHLDLEQDHAGFAENGEKVQAVDFNYDDVDTLLGLVQETKRDARADAAELFGKILQFCFSSQRTRLKTAAARFVTIGASIRPDLLSDRTFAELGAELNISKAAISKIATQFEDAFDFQLTRCRSAAARDSMREAQKKIWRTKRSGNRRPEGDGGHGMPSQEVSLNGAPPV